MNKKLIILIVLGLTFGISERAASIGQTECYHNGQYFATILVDTCDIAHADFSRFQQNNCTYDLQLIDPSDTYDKYVSMPVLEVTYPGNGCFVSHLLHGQPPSLCVIGSNSNSPNL